MKMKKLLAVVTAAVLTIATAMTAYAAPVASGGDVPKDEPEDILTPEEEEILKNAVTDKVSAVGENGTALVTIALDYNKVDEDVVVELSKQIDKSKSPGTLVGLYEVGVATAAGEEYTGKVTLTFKVDGVKSGDTVTIVHYLTDADGNLTGEIEYIKPDSVGNGTVTATFTSLSPIGIVVQVAKAEKAPVKTTTAAAKKTTASKKSPKTGNEDYTMIMLLSAAALGVMTAAYKKGKKA